MRVWERRYRRGCGVLALRIIRMRGSRVAGLGVDIWMNFSFALGWIKVGSVPRVRDVYFAQRVGKRGVRVVRTSRVRR